MRPIDRFIEQFQKRSLRSYFLGKHRLHPRDLAGWIYPSEDRLRKAEEVIGKPLPPSYRLLVQSFHPLEMPLDLNWIGGVGACWLRGIEGGPPDLDDIVRQSSTFLIPLMTVGDCEEVCFDTRRVDADGEYRLVRWDGSIHDPNPHPTTEFEIWAESLGELLLGLVDRLPHIDT